jgi:hypothetical protein
VGLWSEDVWKHSVFDIFCSHWCHLYEIELLKFTRMRLRIFISDPAKRENDDTRDVEVVIGEFHDR